MTFETAVIALASKPASERSGRLAIVERIGRRGERIPRDRENDYTRDAAQARRAFLEQETDAELEHISQYSFDPSLVSGNIEQFIGVAQVPIGIAGPLLVDGERIELRIGDVYATPLRTPHALVVESHRARYVSATVVRSAARYEDFLRAVAVPVPVSAAVWHEGGDAARLAALAAPNGIEILDGPHAVSP